MDLHKLIYFTARHPYCCSMIRFLKAWVRHNTSSGDPSLRCFPLAGFMVAFLDHFGQDLFSNLCLAVLLLFLCDLEPEYLDRHVIADPDMPSC